LVVLEGTRVFQQPRLFTTVGYTSEVQSVTLLTIVAFLNADSDAPPLIFVFWYSLSGFALVAVGILWHLRYERKWRQFRAQHWHQISGKFDDGDIVTMRKGRAGPISGYQIWLGYDYEAEGEQVGLYTLPFYGEFPNKEVAEQCRMKIANRAVIVRVSPRKSKAFLRVGSGRFALSW
jgi:hypothetical protein